MKSKAVVVALLIGVFFLDPRAEARGPYGSISVGNWKGGAFTNDASGEFTSCSAFAPYRSGITLYVIISANMTWRLGFSNEGWNLTTGQKFPIVLTFDGQQPFNVSAAVIGPKLMAVELPDNSTLIDQFRKSKTMSAYAQGQLFQFDMSGTSALLPVLANCVAKTRALGVEKVGDFSVPLPARPPAKPLAAAGAEAASPPEKPATIFDQSGTGFV